MTNRVPFRFGVLTMVVAALTHMPLAAQDALRGWSAFTWDTDAYRLPALQIAAGWHDTAVLRGDGRIYVHGAETGNFGICTPPQAPPGQHFTSIAIMNGDGLAIVSDGTMVHWHHGGSIYLEPVPPLPPSVGYVSVSLAWQHALALRTDGVLVGWHDRIGTGLDPLTAVPTFPPGVSVRKFHAAGLCSMALLSDGSIRGWGYNYYGELNIPPLPTNTSYIDLWGGDYHFLARRSDGAIVSWGDNSMGQCDVPVLPSGVHYVDFAGGLLFTLALRSDGQLDAWGDNTGGQCNLTSLPPGSAVVQLAANTFTSVVRLADGSVIGWGGVFGDLPLALPPANDRFVDIATGGGVALGLTSAGEVLGYGAYLPWLLTAPPLPAGLSYEKVYLGWRHAGALRSDGHLILWGDNPDGRCSVPSLPPGLTYVQAALGSRYSVALRSDGEIYAFGYPGQIVPIPALPSGVRYVKADVEDNDLVLLRSDGLIELGGWATPALPPGLVYVDVAAGPSFRAALRSDGQVVAWYNSGTPFPVPPLPTGVVYVEIDCGTSHLTARRSDGQVVASVNATSSGEDRITALNPGESYVQISTRFTHTTGRVGPTRTYVSFANGCAGTLPSARLIPRDTPHIGATHTVRMLDLPQNGAFMVFGWNRTQPIPLSPQGMPGCFQHVSLDTAFFVAGQNGQAVFNLPIPNWPGLVGLHFHNQAIVLDPGANGLGAVVSDAAEGVIGHR